ncbi:MAG: hypothetical protein HY368_00535 [Candidatus Aenigmarchaeota archaeon]|nr:hypothetical protein [Candidatus Aenigmarchaeota archaeon]
MRTKTKLHDAKGVKQLRKGCPRCGSYRTYSTDLDFICMACSYIVVKS